MNIKREAEDFLNARENKKLKKGLEKRTVELNDVKVTKANLYEYYMTLHDGPSVRLHNAVGEVAHRKQTNRTEKYRLLYFSV